MDVPTLTMPRDEALAKLEAYRESTRRRADAEHAAAVEAYRALADGTPLLSLQDAFRNLVELNTESPGEGFDDKWRPAVAVARADRRQVEFSWSRTTLTFDAHRYGGRSSDTLVRRVDVGVECPTERPWTTTGYALVPMIPAEVRNAMSGRVRDHFVLWEVEAWSDRRIRAEPDRDPLLLRPIGDPATTDLYAVVAEWDLTEVERFVMRSRAAS